MKTGQMNFSGDTILSALRLGETNDDGVECRRSLPLQSAILADDAFPALPAYPMDL
ncbi:MAG TPA: hypothetical protein PKY22_08820 [Accumulibacter sp.]|nr:hypothetical protein [Accumulibacter sp.]